MNIITYHILRYKNSVINGILLNRSKYWTLTKNNEVDYVLNGFKLTNNKYISHEQEIPCDSIMHRILSRKYDIEIDHGIVESITMEDNMSLFVYFQNNNTLLTIGTDCESIVFVGRVLNVNRCSCEFQLYDTNLDKCKRTSFKYNQIRYIEFDTDYLNSLSLIEKLDS